MLSTSLMKVTCNKKIADPLFLFYFFRSARGRYELLKNASQVGTPGIATPLTSLKAVRVPLPPLTEQQAIAEILGSLDDKIELNRRMNETLEGMARAIFKSWFVDFNPVRAKAAGRQPAGMDADTAALFPDRFEDSPLGPMPATWTVGKVGTLVKLSRESLNPGDFPHETFAHFSIPAFDEARLPAREQGDRIKSNKSLVVAAAVLLSKLNPRIPRVWVPSCSPGVRRVCSTEFLVATPAGGYTTEYLWAYFLSHDFIERFASLVTGTSGSHQRVNAEHLLAMQCLLPPSTAVTRFTDVAGPILRRVAQGLHESQALAAVRDALLPKLLSGDLPIRRPRDG
jgi:type I restriction enzyme S subunit